MAIVFTLGGLGVVKGRIRFAQQAMLELIEEINPYLLDSGFIDGAPFKLVSGIVRYTDVTSAEPRVDAINRVHGELPFAVEMSIPEFRVATKDVVRARMDALICDALTRIADLYQRPRSGIEAYCNRLDPHAGPVQASGLGFACAAVALRGMDYREGAEACVDVIVKLSPNDAYKGVDNIGITANSVRVSSTSECGEVLSDRVVGLLRGVKVHVPIFRRASHLET